MRFHSVFSIEQTKSEKHEILFIWNSIFVDLLILKLNQPERMFQIDRYLKFSSSIEITKEQKATNQHCNGEREHRNGRQKHRNNEHHEVTAEKVQQFLEHYDQANQIQTNELSNEIHLSSNFNLKKSQFWIWYSLCLTEQSINLNFLCV